MGSNTSTQQIQTPALITSPPSPDETPVIQKKHSSMLFYIFILLLVIGIGGIGYFLFHSKNSEPIKQTKIISKRTSPSSVPTYYSLSSQETNSVSKSASPAPLSNKAEIGDEKTLLQSPDKIKTATYYTTSPQMGEGGPIFNSVDIFDKTTGNTQTYHLSGPITRASGQLFWSPVDNRIYFVHAGNGIGIYALWSTNPDGTDAKLISGTTDTVITPSGPPDLHKALNNSAIYGARAYDFSPDGKMIATIRYYPPGSSNEFIWVMNYDGTNSHEIPIQGTYSGSDIYKITWEADGKHLVFTEWNSKTNYVIGLSGGEPIKVASQN